MQKEATYHISSTSPHRHLRICSALAQKRLMKRSLNGIAYMQAISGKYLQTVPYQGHQHVDGLY